MKYNTYEIKEGIQLHVINTNKFKTNLNAIFLTAPITRENVTKNALITAVLRRGTENMKTQEEISKNLEEMYGADFDCGLDKTGDNHILKFYIETINDKYSPLQNDTLLEDGLNKLIEIVFNPLIQNESFKKEYVEGEKESIRQIIEGKIDNKASYAINRCVEEMYKDKPYGLYKFGYIEDLDSIDNKNLYEYYKTLLKQCKIDIYVSGNIENNVEEIIEKNENIQKLEKREPKYIRPYFEKNENQEIKEISDSMDVAQGKLVIGLNVENENEEEKYVALMYNAILGGTANSKLFQNVREKASLAYTSSSQYIRQKNAIFINSGIEIENYQKVMDIIKEQLKDMEEGKFEVEDIENVKKGIISTIKSIDDEQDTEIAYFLGQEISGTNTTIEEYEEKVNNIKKEDIVNLAKKIKINTIYFLKN